MKLSVVIVSYNVKYYLEQCLESLSRSLSGIDAEVYVVDNHSKDNSVEYLLTRFPEKDNHPSSPLDIHFIASQHNLGFARANNLAIKKCKSEYILLLNPDTIVGEDTISKALAFMDEHSDAGSLGVRMLDVAGRSAKESRRGLPSPMVAFYKMSGLCAHFPKSRRFGHYYMSGMSWDDVAQIEVVSGAFCMLRKAAIDQVGCLDEDFFMYGEDIDLSYRILKGGYHNYYLPSCILHYKGESTQKSSFRYVHVFYEAMLIFFRKHYSGMSFLLSIPIKAAIYAKATVALFRMQIEKAHRSLGFVSYEWDSPLYIFVGSKKMLQTCKELAKNKGLMAQFVEAGKELPEMGNGIEYVVFDTDTFSYKQVFEMFSAHPQPMRKMAFYHSDTGKLITENEVIG